MQIFILILISLCTSFGLHAQAQSIAPLPLQDWYSDDHELRGILKSNPEWARTVGQARVTRAIELVRIILDRAQERLSLNPQLMSVIENPTFGVNFFVSKLEFISKHLSSTHMKVTNDKEWEELKAVEGGAAIHNRDLRPRIQLSPQVVSQDLFSLIDLASVIIHEYTHYFQADLDLIDMAPVEDPSLKKLSPAQRLSVRKERDATRMEVALLTLAGVPASFNWYTSFNLENPYGPQVHYQIFENKLESALLDALNGQAAPDVLTTAISGLQELQISSSFISLVKKFGTYSFYNGGSKFNFRVNVTARLYSQEIPPHTFVPQKVLTAKSHLAPSDESGVLNNRVTLIQLGPGPIDSIKFEELTRHRNYGMDVYQNLFLGDLKFSR